MVMVGLALDNDVNPLAYQPHTRLRVVLERGVATPRYDETLIPEALAVLAAAKTQRNRKPPPAPPVYDHPRQKSRQVQRAEARAERKERAR